MARQIIIIGAIFVVAGLVFGSLAYYAADQMVSNTPDRGAATSGAAPPSEAPRQ